VAAGPLPLLGWSQPGLSGLGAHVFGVALALCAASAVGFVMLDRHIRV
jgi:hypothetical protein